MKLTSNLDSYPVFPNWVFTGKIPLPESTLQHVLAEVPSMQKDTPAKETYQLSQVVGSIFFDTVKSHFRLPKSLQHIESVDSHFINISPGHAYPVRVNRHRWYQGAAFLQCGKGASDIYLDMFDSKLYSTPPEVQEYQHVIEAEPLKLAFWPAHMPWGLNVNNSGSNTILFTTTFIIKR